MIQTDLRELVLEEAKALPLLKDTRHYEPHENDEMQMFVFYQPGDSRAYVAYFGFVANERDGVFEIRRVGVHDTHKGKGWGRAVVECLERIAKACGYDRVRVEKNKTPAFWAHMGYQPSPAKYEKVI